MLNLHQDSSTGKYTVFVNASGYKTSACPRRAFFTFLAGLKESALNSFKMEFGTAVHYFFRHYYAGKDQKDCFFAAINHYAPFVEQADWRDMEYLVTVCKAWLEHDKATNYFKPIALPDGLALEQPFAIPFYSSSVADYVLCGTIDMLATHQLYGRIIVDHKTTSVRTVDSYLDAYEFSPQLAIYIIAAKRLGLNLSGAVINGIFMGKNSTPKFQVSGLVEFSERKLTETEHLLREFVKSLDKILVDYLKFRDEPIVKTLCNAAPRNFTQCQGTWGMCPFVPLCRLDNEAEITALAKDLYESKPYNPLTFQEIE